MIRVTWVLEGYGAGSAEVADMEGAVRALSGGIRAALADLDPPALAHVLHTAVGPLRHTMQTSGVEALADSGEWSARSGGIFVSAVRL